MDIRHAKVSGLANAEAGKVGGGDWDEAHRYGAGSLFTYGLVRFGAGPSYGGVADTGAECLGGIVGVIYDPMTYQVTFQLDLAGLPVAQGAQVDFFMDFSQLALVPPPQYLKFSWRNNENLIFEIVGPNWSPQDYTEDVQVTGRLLAFVGQVAAP